MSQTQQHSFVNELVNKADQVTGLRLTLNKFLVLFLKCLYIRKRKKIISLIELLIPLVIFYYLVYNLNSVFLLTKWKPRTGAPGRASAADQANDGYLFGAPRSYGGRTIYYDFNSTNVVGSVLESFLVDALNETGFPKRFERRPLENLTMLDYTALYFNVFNSKNIDYEMRIADGSELLDYSSWKHPQAYEQFELDSNYLRRLEADKFHERILRLFTGQLNSRTADYDIEFDKLLLDDDSPPVPPAGIGENERYNPQVFRCFVIAFGCAFFINCIFVLTAVCDEKKTKSFDFLKLMGASDGQIFFGHFANHMLFWTVSFLLCTGYFVYFLGSIRVPTQATLVLLVFGLLYLAHTIVFLFLLSTLFKRYLYPELLNIVLFYYCFKSYQEKTYQSGFGGFLKLAHPLNMLIRFQKICVESLSNRFNFRDSNVLEIFGYSDGRELSLTDLLLADLLFIVIEIALINYIIQVNPFQTGVRKPFLYFLTWQYWRRSEPVTQYTQLGDQKEFEKVPSSRRPAIILKSVDKWFRSWFVFGKFQVLKGFDFAIYEKQITVLLGHNGAGKSTTMNLIAGLSTADRGSITVNGIPVSGYTSEFKSQLGYCPQENVFYQRLTVFENLRIAATLKGLSLCSGSASQKIRSLAEKFDLQSKVGECSKNLSGGMKRRLCLAMAVIGYNDVLVIDEPTSGLDPETRRRIWEILLELRKYRTILLTTHFLEEADILGDSIAIMYDGKVKCCGSTIFLKKLYHVGYLLRVQTSAAATTKADQQTQGLLQLIRQHIPDAFLETQRANEWFYRLTCNVERQGGLNLMIAGLLDAFEHDEIKSKYQIEAYGLTNTTLEDVFIKIGTLDERSPDQAIAIDGATVEQHPLYRMQRLNGAALYAQQFWAIQCKKLKMNYKNLALLFQSIYFVMAPVLLAMLLTIGIESLIQTSDLTIETFNLRQLAGKKEILVMRNGSAGSAESNLFRPENLAWLNREYGLRIVESKEATVKKAVAEEMLKWTRSGLKDRLVILPHRTGNFSYRIAANPFHMPYSLMGTMEAVYRLIAREANPQDSDFGVNFKFSYSRAAQQELSEEDRGQRTVKMFAEIMKIAVFRLLFALPCSFLLALMFSFPFVGFVELPHEEMNSGALSMQIIAGLSKTVYWIGNLVFDYLYSLLVVAIGLAIIVFYVQDDVLSPQILALLGAFTLALLNCLLVTYFTVNLNFSKELTDSLVKWPLFVAGLAIGLYDVIYCMIAMPAAQQFAMQEQSGASVEVIKRNVPGHFWFLLLSPVYNVLDTFYQVLDLKIGRVCRDELKSENCALIESRDYDFKYNAAAYLLSTLIFGLLIILINHQTGYVLRAIESLKVQWFRPRVAKEIRSRCSSQTNADYLTDVLEDPNVHEASQLAQLLIETNSLQSNILVVHDLYKLYGSLEAVNHLSFTVKRGECFGLLGINGAGKTTTFKMIGGSVVPTAGSIVLDGYTFESQPHEYYRRLGYCPQENTHTKRITVNENLRYYARINGVPAHLVASTVRTLVEECDLQEHRHKFADNLSGGNMRKLSTAISLIGKKDLILLDEMSTGVDPVARRKLWKTIDFYKRELHSSFILTSHSMDEVENLCSTISIMAAGRLKCLGSFNYLRDRYSQGFTILIKIKEQYRDRDDHDAYVGRLKQRMETDFNGKASLKEFYMNTVVYIILSKVFKWPHLFRAMEQIKEDLDLEDFLVSDTNLEQIFLSFAQQN